MKISVVISTYNGELYIEEQLASIYHQTRTPDEVLINDDQSKDSTCKIVEDFIRKHNLENWKLHVNNPNKGCCHNFVDSAMAASGDVVFYCDQDDIWDCRKIEKMEKGFVSYPDMLACYCLESYVDEHGRLLKSTFDFMHNVKSSKRGFNKVSFEENVRINKCPGLCLAFKKDILTNIKPMLYEKELMHDLSIGNYASLHNGFYVLNEKLVKYRQHSANLSTPKFTIASRVSSIDYQIRGRKGRLRQYNAFYEYFKEDMTKKQQIHFEDMLSEVSKSIDYLSNRRITPLFGQIFHCNPFLNRWISINNFLCVLYEKFR